MCRMLLTALTFWGSWIGGRLIWGMTLQTHWKGSGAGFWSETFSSIVKKQNGAEQAGLWCGDGWLRRSASRRSSRGKNISEIVFEQDSCSAHLTPLQPVCGLHQHRWGRMKTYWTSSSSPQPGREQYNRRAGTCTSGPTAYFRFTSVTFCHKQIFLNSSLNKWFRPTFIYFLRDLNERMKATCVCTVNIKPQPAAC